MGSPSKGAEGAARKGETLRKNEWRVARLCKMEQLEREQEGGIPEASAGRAGRKGIPRWRPRGRTFGLGRGDFGASRGQKHFSGLRSSELGRGKCRNSLQVWMIRWAGAQ